MTNTLRGKLAGKLAAISSLTSLFATGSIEEYIEEENGDLFAAIANLKPPRLLVYVAGISTGRQMGLFSQRLAMAIRGDVDPLAVYAAIVNEAPSGDSLALPFQELDAHYEPMGIPELERQFIQVGEGSSLSYWNLSVVFRSRSSDTTFVA